jgi:hypothetical protein
MSIVDWPSDRPQLGAPRLRTTRRCLSTDTYTQYSLYSTFLPLPTNCAIVLACGTSVSHPPFFRVDDSLVTPVLFRLPTIYSSETRSPPAVLRRLSLVTHCPSETRLPHPALWRLAYRQVVSGDPVCKVMIVAPGVPDPIFVPHIAPSGSFDVLA